MGEVLRHERCSVGWTVGSHLPDGTVEGRMFVGSKKHRREAVSYNCEMVTRLGVRRVGQELWRLHVRALVTFRSSK